MFSKFVEISDYFPDIVKFFQSISTYQKMAGIDELDERKRYRLAKNVATLRIRVDRFYLSASFLYWAGNSGICPVRFTDHHLITSEICFNQ